MKTTTTHLQQQDVNHQQQILDVLHQLVASVDRLSADVQQLQQHITTRQHRPSRQQLMAAMVRCIGTHAFTSSELHAYAAVMPQLAAMFDHLHINGARSVGKLLRKMEGTISNGIQLQQIGVESGSIIWQLQVLVPPGLKPR